MKILYFILAVIIYKGLSNFIFLKQINTIETEFLKYLASEKNDAALHSHLFKKLAIRAGTSEKYLPIVQPLGFGQISSSQVRIIDHFPSNRYDMVSGIEYIILNCKSTFYSRMIEALSPIYWIELIIFMPQKLIEYLNFNESVTFNRFLNIVWWIFCFIWGGVSFLYQDELSSLIKNSLPNLLNQRP